MLLILIFLTDDSVLHSDLLFMKVVRVIAGQAREPSSAIGCDHKSRQ